MPHHSTATAHGAIADLQGPHRGGHRCVDNAWWNDNTGDRRSCPVLRNLATIADTLDQLTEQVHAAAHDTAAAEHVAESMTGFTLADLPTEQREGWTMTARLAIESLSEWLDRDPAREKRVAAIRARLAGT